MGALLQDWSLLASKGVVGERIRSCWQLSALPKWNLCPITMQCWALRGRLPRLPFAQPTGASSTLPFLPAPADASLSMIHTSSEVHV